MDLIGRYPWLAEFLTTNRRARAEAPLRAIGDRTDAWGAELPVHEPEAFHEAWAILDSAYEALEITTDFSSAFFIRCRTVPSASGEASKQMMGAEAAKGLPRVWCDRFRMNQSSSWSVQEHGEDFGTTCALEWCSRCRHYYAIWYPRSDDVRFAYTDYELCSYVPSASWSRFAEAAKIGTAAGERIMLVCMLVPSNPG